MNLTGLSTYRDELVIGDIVKVAWLEFVIMKRFCFAAALVALTVGCASTWPAADNRITEQIPADTTTRIPRANCLPRGDSTSKPPVLSVCVSYSDTQLILPWFITGIINAVSDP